MERKKQEPQLLAKAIKEARRRLREWPKWMKP
jgi:hypothetical protein